MCIRVQGFYELQGRYRLDRLSLHLQFGEDTIGFRFRKKDNDKVVFCFEMDQDDFLQFVKAVSEIDI